MVLTFLLGALATIFVISSCITIHAKMEWLKTIILLSVTILWIDCGLVCGSFPPHDIILGGVVQKFDWAGTYGWLTWLVVEVGHLLGTHPGLMTSVSKFSLSVWLGILRAWWLGLKREHDHAKNQCSKNKKAEVSSSLKVETESWHYIPSTTCF